MDLLPSFFLPHCLPTQYFVPTYHLNQPVHTCKPKGPNFDNPPPRWQGQNPSYSHPAIIEHLWTLEAGPALNPAEKRRYLAARKHNSPRHIWVSSPNTAATQMLALVCSDADEEIIRSRESYLLGKGHCNECATAAPESEGWKGVERRNVQWMVAEGKTCIEIGGVPTLMDLCRDADVELILSLTPFYGGVLEAEDCVFVGPLEEGLEGARKRLEKARGVKLVLRERPGRGVNSKRQY